MCYKLRLPIYLHSVRTWKNSQKYLAKCLAHSTWAMRRTFWKGGRGNGDENIFRKGEWWDSANTMDDTPLPCFLFQSGLHRSLGGGRRLFLRYGQIHVLWDFSLYFIAAMKWKPGDLDSRQSALPTKSSFRVALGNSSSQPFAGPLCELERGII